MQDKDNKYLKELLAAFNSTGTCFIYGEQVFCTECHKEYKMGNWTYKFVFSNGSIIVIGS